MTMRTTVGVLLISLTCLTAAGQFTSIPTLPEVTYRRAYLGIEILHLSKDKAQKLGFKNLHGSYVEKVIPNTTADQAGIQPFDYIYGIDEYRVSQTLGLAQILERFHTGDQANVLLIRRSERHSVPVHFTPRPASNTEAEDPCEAPFLGVRLSLQSPAADGVRVNIIDNSTAKAMGMESGDILLKIDGHPMIDWDDVRIAINNAVVGRNIDVIFQRNGSIHSGSNPIKSYCATIIKDGMQLTEAETDILTFEMEKIHPLFIRELNTNLQTSFSEANDLPLTTIDILANHSPPTLQFTLPNRGKTTIKIYNTSGRLLYDYERRSFSGSFRTGIELFEINSIYYLEIQQNEKSIIFKIEAK